MTCFHCNLFEDTCLQDVQDLDKYLHHDDAIFLSAVRAVRILSAKRFECHSSNTATNPKSSNSLYSELKIIALGSVNSYLCSMSLTLSK